MSEEWEPYSFKEVVYNLTNKLDEYTAAELACLEQMVNDDFNAPAYYPWATNEQCIVDCIRSIFGGVLQKECKERRQGWAEYNAANW